MGTVVAVWGNNGCGKSTLAIKVANELARRRLNVLLIDASFNAPQINIWFPNINMKPEMSLSVLLDNNITKDALFDKLQVISGNLGALGYSKNHATNSLTSRTDTSAALLQTVKASFDVTIVDCQSLILADPFSYEAAYNGDTCIVCLTPDVRGLSWYDSNVKMVEEQWKNDEKKVLKALMSTNAYSPITEIEHIIGKVDFCLPYTPVLEEQQNAGTLADSHYPPSARQYEKVIESIALEIEKS